MGWDGGEISGDDCGNDGMSGWAEGGGHEARRGSQDYCQTRAYHAGSM